MTEMKLLSHEALDAGAAGIALSYLGAGNNHTDFDGTPMPTDVMFREDALMLAGALGERDEGVVKVLSALPGVRQDWEFAAELSKAAANRPNLV